MVYEYSITEPWYHGKDICNVTAVVVIIVKLW